MPNEPNAQQPDGGAESTMEAALHALDGSAPCSDDTCICCGVIYPRIKDVLTAWDSRAAIPPASLVLTTIPTTWLDPILTGPAAAFDGNAPATTNVEAVLRAVKYRLAELLAAKEGV